MQGRYGVCRGALPNDLDVVGQIDLEIIVVEVRVPDHV